MQNINDLQIGIAGEYLVCADLILNGHIAFLTQQGCPFDIVLRAGKRLLKVQVKTTRGPKNIPQRATMIPAYVFHIGNNGKENRRKKYDADHVDIFAVVALDSKRIIYLPYFNTQTTMNFRVPELRGSYHDEQAVKKKDVVMELKGKMPAKKIAEETGLSLYNVYKYSSTASIAQRGTNAGVYFDDPRFTLENCLNAIVDRLG